MYFVKKVIVYEDKGVNAMDLSKNKGKCNCFGGFNGGGAASMNIKTAIPHCGGGGGALGGNSALNDFSIDIWVIVIR